VLLSIRTFGIVDTAAKLYWASVVLINPVRFDISGQEHLLEGPASVMMQSLLSEAFGDHPVSSLDGHFQ
jgi:NAD-dependent deacetylase